MLNNVATTFPGRGGELPLHTPDEQAVLSIKRITISFTFLKFSLNLWLLVLLISLKPRSISDVRRVILGIPPDVGVAGPEQEGVVLQPGGDGGEVIAGVGVIHVRVAVVEQP